jgi:hypothetical protein
MIRGLLVSPGNLPAVPFESRQWVSHSHLLYVFKQKVMLVLGQEEGWRGIGSGPRKECDKEGTKDLLLMPFSQRRWGMPLYLCY